MKVKMFFMFFISVISLNVLSQITISMGVYTGASSTNSLLATSTSINRYSRTMSIYTDEEINLAGGTAGTITSLAWEKYGSGEYLFDDAYIKIYLKHVTNDIWSTSPVPVWDTEIVGATEVFTSSTYSIPAGTGWKTIPFTTPFVWNGTQNIVVMVEWYRPSTPTADINWGRSTDNNTNATRVGSTSLAALVMLVNSSRPLLQLTFSDPVDSISVATQGNVPAIIDTDGGILQLEATVHPSTANQSVTWTIVNGTGDATISTTGLVLALENGTVWAKAVSDQDPSKMDSLMITISNQLAPVTSLTVSTQGGLPADINTPGGTLQMVTTVLPANAGQDVTWSIVPVTGSAAISTSGLVTAQTNGTVWAKAVSDYDISKMDSLEITITNQDLSIENVLTETGFIMYPNPVTNGLLHFELSQKIDTDNALLIILDANGKTIRKEIVLSANFSIPLNNLPFGVYSVLITDQSKTYKSRFVLEK